jgi:hypothetical protein
MAQESEKPGVAVALAATERRMKCRRSLRCAISCGRLTG